MHSTKYLTINHMVKVLFHDAISYKTLHIFDIRIQTSGFSTEMLMYDDES